MGDAQRLRAGAVDLKIRAPVAGGRFDDWREAFGRAFLRLDVEPSGEVFSTELALRALPGLSLGSVSTSACRMIRTAELVDDGQNDIALIAMVRGSGRAQEKGGREVEFREGEAVFVRNGRQGFVEYSDDSRHFAFAIPEHALAPFIGDVDAACMSAIPTGDGPLDLLVRYAGLVVADSTLALEAGGAVARHIHDLAAILMARSPEASAALTHGGARAAARLAAIKADVLARLGDSDLSVSSVAIRLGITPRYVAKLFEHEGTTFTAFVLEQRLRHARGLLEDRSRAELSISAIALASGFGDISYFNRCFRRRYGMTPSDAKAAGWS